MTAVVLPLPGAQAQAASLAAQLGARVGEVEFRRFPDGESYYRIACQVHGCDAIVVSALRDPDALALGLWFVADTAREMGATRIGLVAPYLPYMRQDARFHPGEAVTSRSFARFVSQAFDWLVTVDPHLHRYPTLDAVYTIPSVVVTSALAVARWVQSTVANPVVIGPDSESEQWASDVARRVGCPSQVLSKTRLGDRHVQVSLPDPGLVEGRQPVLLDDIISSGHTMAEAVRHVRSAFRAAPVCIGVHALFAPQARQLLLAAGASQVLTCNTVPDVSNAVDVLPDIAAAVRLLLAGPAQAGV
ncbi:MAG: ribose-phosphate pyrophosphokinase [Ramlibacter sp.]